MKKGMRNFCYSMLLSSMLLSFGLTAQAEEAATIKTGVYAEEIDLSGKTGMEAESAIAAYVESLKDVEITLVAANNKEVTVKAGDFQISWGNPELVTEALNLGTKGNVIERYKVIKEIEQEGKILDIELAFDMQAINDVLIEKCSKYDQKPMNYSLKKENDTFEVVKGQVGYTMDVETSIDAVYDYLTEEWDGKPCRITLNIVTAQPKGSAEELAQVKDVLGSYTTSYKSSTGGRAANVENAGEKMNGITVYPGEEFCSQPLMAPFTEANGYYAASSYINGKVVDSIGGGICQVSTTLYNAVLLAELEVTMRYSHSMTVSYVDPSADAAIASSAGKDFKFVNNTEAPIYIECYTKNKEITFNIYGKETRDPGRSIRYESEILETTMPQADEIIADPAQPLGYIAKEGAHIGYKARLWKIVTENGVEVSKTQVNRSTYKMSPRSAVVGVATADSHAYEEIMAAIGTANIEHVEGVIARLTTPIVQEMDEE
ncbi:MAG: VanW family protein [Lachnoclostridium sp.]|nr:VanW family protein [Lachnospira sp.]MCM1248909.1 VanW family protein [Lachnoclostridium sp.]MCM1535235.1 VanW family protein [Clostridium sp.]